MVSPTFDRETTFYISDLVKSQNNIYGQFKSSILKPQYQVENKGIQYSRKSQNTQQIIKLQVNT